MNIIVFNKREFNNFMTYSQINDENVESQDMFIVSINEFYKKDTLFADKYTTKSHFKRQHSNVMIEHFGDYHEDYIKRQTPHGTFGFFTEYKAKKLYEFIKRNKDKSLAIIHCGAGVSRSGAVGTFIFDLYGTITWDQFVRKNPRVVANEHILRLLIEQYNKDTDESKES